MDESFYIRRHSGVLFNPKTRETRFTSFLRLNFVHLLKPITPIFLRPTCDLYFILSICRGRTLGSFPWSKNLIPKSLRSELGRRFVGKRDSPIRACVGRRRRFYTRTWNLKG